MADKLALAGTVGTWVAVFLAILALAGILPAYLLVRRSRDQKHRAIAAIDDPTGRFVTRGFRIRILRGFRKIKVPDLKEPPRFGHSQPPQLTNCTLSQQFPFKDNEVSTTGWVNFAALCTSVFKDLKSITKSEGLHFEEDRSYLEVHPGWLFLLGILHRYGHRVDLGLPPNSSKDGALQQLDSSRCLSGLSGVLQSGRKGIQFRIHNPSDLRQSIIPDAIPLSHLCLLFMNLLPGPGGVLISTRRPRPTYGPNYHYVPNDTRQEDVKMVILRLKQSYIPREECLNYALLLGVLPRTINNCKIMDCCEVTEEPDENYAHIGRIKIYKPDVLGCDNREKDSWILRKDLHTILLLYIKGPMSPRSFLYNSRDDIILSHIFRVEIFKIIHAATRIHLDQANFDVGERAALLARFLQINVNDKFGRTWSRNAMVQLWEFDQEISKTAFSKSLKTLSITMLYMYNHDFRESIIKLTNIEEGNTPIHIRFNLERGTITIPPPQTSQNEGPETDFSFNFEETFRETHGVALNQLSRTSPDGDITLSLADCILACFLGQVRALMWKMSLSPEGLEKFLTAISLDTLQDISANTRIMTDSTIYDQWPAPRFRRSGSVPADLESGLHGDDNAQNITLGGTKSAKSDSPKPAQIPRQTEETVLKEGVKADTGNSYHYTSKPLYLAAANGHERVVKLMLEARKNVDSIESESECTALLQAAQNGHEAVVKQLLETDKVAVNCNDEEGWTPLSLAAASGHEEIVKNLLEAGADISDKGDDGMTPLSWAALNGHEEVVKLLVGAEKAKIGAGIVDNAPSQGTTQPGKVGEDDGSSS